MDTHSTSSTGCLAVFAFFGWVIIGSVLSMPATAFYLYLNDPAQLHRSDHWLLIAGLAPVAAGFTARWTTRRQPRPLSVIAVRSAVLLAVSFVGTWWVLEAYRVPVGGVTLVSIFTGWASIAVMLLLIPLLNRAMGLPRPAAAAPAPAPRPQRPRPKKRPAGQARTPKQAPTRPKQGKDRPPPAEGQRHRPPNSDGDPQFRTKPGGGHGPRGDGDPRYRAQPQPKPGPRPQGDGDPRYRTKPPMHRQRAQGDGDPVFRDTR